jgi:hypothetical protein
MIRPMWTREAIATHVDALAARGDFVDAVKRFSVQLTEAERAVLAEVLLARAGTVEYAWDERVKAKGWFRRQWDRADPR